MSMRSEAYFTGVGSENRTGAYFTGACPVQFTSVTAQAYFTGVASGNGTGVKSICSI